MDYQRYYDLNWGNAELTRDEILAGWHFCADWDFLLVGPHSPEIVGCTHQKELKKLAHLGATKIEVLK